MLRIMRQMLIDSCQCGWIRVSHQNRDGQGVCPRLQGPRCPRMPQCIKRVARDQLTGSSSEQFLFGFASKVSIGFLNNTPFDAPGLLQSSRELTNCFFRYCLTLLSNSSFPHPNSQPVKPTIDSVCCPGGALRFSEKTSVWVHLDQTLRDFCRSIRKIDAPRRLLPFRLSTRKHPTLIRRVKVSSVNSERLLWSSARFPSDFDQIAQRTARYKRQQCGRCQLIRREG